MSFFYKWGLRDKLVNIVEHLATQEPDIYLSRESEHWT